MGGHFYIRAVIRGERGRDAFHSFQVFGIIKIVNEYMRHWSFMGTVIYVASVLKENGQKRIENKDCKLMSWALRCTTRSIHAPYKSISFRPDSKMYVHLYR